MAGTEAFQVSSVSDQGCGLISGQQRLGKKRRGGPSGEGTRHVAHLVAMHSGGSGFNLETTQIYDHFLSVQMTLADVTK